MKRRAMMLLTAAAAMVSWGCRKEVVRPRELTVACAASLRPVMEMVVEAYAVVRPGMVLRCTYGASGTLQAQAMEGAPFDVFLGADEMGPAALAAAGVGGEPFGFAEGRLALWVRKDSGLDVEGLGLRVLLDPRVKKVAVANPELAPYGRAAMEVIGRAGMEAAVKGRMVFAENVAQAAQYVASGSAQAGLVAWSLTLSPAMVAEGTAWLVPETAHAPLVHAGVVLKRTGEAEQARAFCEWLRGPDGGELLGRGGLKPVKR